jgi:hypothetical protein
MTMARKLLFWGALALSVQLAACGGNDQAGGAAPKASTPQTVDTAHVLSLAEVTSETGTPFPVDGGLVTFSDTSESSAPISVNAK